MIGDEVEHHVVPALVRREVLDGVVDHVIGADRAHVFGLRPAAHARDLGAHFILSEGIVHAAQPEQAMAAARSIFPADAWSVAALHVVTTLTGSALLALALLRGAMNSDDVWAAAHVDDDWNVEKWGLDEEVAARRAARFIDFRAAVTVLEAMKA